MSGFLRVKNWREHQHYNDREPPWIKLQRKLLKDDSFLTLEEWEQWQLVRIWMIATDASRFTLDEKGRRVPVVVNDERVLRRAIASLRKVALASFVDEGWLIRVPEAGLVVLAPSEPDASADASALYRDRGSEVHKEIPKAVPGLDHPPGTDSERTALGLIINDSLEEAS